MAPFEYWKGDKMYLGTLKTVGFALVLLGCATTGALAQSSPPGTVQLDAVASTLSNMGYSPRTSQGNVTFDAGNYVINVSMSGDNSIVYLSAYYSIKPEQAAKLPALKLLTYNNTHRSYAYTSTDNNGVPTSVGVNIQVMAQGFSPQTMRQAIDGITGDMGSNQTLFYPGNW